MAASPFLRPHRSDASVVRSTEPIRSVGPCQASGAAAPAEGTRDAPAHALTVTFLCCLSLGISATTASAALPEVGRCVKVAGVKEGKKTHYDGAYGNAGCDRANAAHAGKYEWLPGPGPKTNFRGTGSRLLIVEQPRDPATVTKCDGAASEGRLTSATGVAMTITYTRCERSENACIEQSDYNQEEALECVPPCGLGHESEPGHECEEWTPCQSEGAAYGEIKTLPLEGQLAFKVGGSKPKIAITLSPAGGGPIATYECAGYKAAFAAMTAGIAPIDEMKTASKLVFPGVDELTDTFEEALEVRGLE